MELNDYQRFVFECSKLHRDAINKRIFPIRQVIDLADMLLNDSASGAKAASFRKEIEEAAKALADLEEKLSLFYVVLGLCGEAGELADKVKKSMRDEVGLLSDERRNNMVQELGDVEWYATDAARVLGTTKQRVIEANKAKLDDRISRGTQGGNGDNR